MTFSWLRTRLARDGAGCALILMFALAAFAAGRQQSDSTTGKSAANSSTATHHTPTKKKTTSSAAKTASHASSGHVTPTKTQTASTGKKSRKKTVRARGQQKIDGDRAEQIQEALIREHYLTGEPTGTWNAASEEAMRRYQANHGWQTKEVPDSRALIKLGLGPSNAHLLNPESAMTTGPDAPRAASLSTASHSAATSANPVAPVSAAPGTSTSPASSSPSSSGPPATPDQHGPVSPQ
jgi:hypothetical protein